MHFLSILLLGAALAATAALLVAPIFAMILIRDLRFNRRHHDHLIPSAPRSYRKAH